MRTEKKEIQKIEYVTTYIANDGTEFKSEDECRKYEDTAACAINAMVEKIPNQKTYDIGTQDVFGDFDGLEDIVHAFKVRSIEDVEAINRFMVFKNKENEQVCLSPDDVGTIQIITEQVYCDHYMYTFGTPEQLKAAFADAVDKLVDKLVEKEGAES